VKLEEIYIGQRIITERGTMGVVLGLYTEDLRCVCVRLDDSQIPQIWCAPKELSAAKKSFEISEHVAKAVLLEAGYRLGEDGLWCDAKSCTSLEVFQTLQAAWNDYTKKFGAA
jgi:hypothetical protein